MNTEKQAVFPCKESYDIGYNYDLKTPQQKDANFFGRGWKGSILYRHLVYCCWCSYRSLFDGNAGLFFFQQHLFFKVNLQISRTYSRKKKDFSNKRAKYLKIWTRMYKILKYFEKG